MLAYSFYYTLTPFKAFFLFFRPTRRPVHLEKGHLYYWVPGTIVPFLYTPVSIYIEVILAHIVVDTPGYSGGREQSRVIFLSSDRFPRKHDGEGWRYGWSFRQQFQRFCKHTHTEHTCTFSRRDGANIEISSLTDVSFTGPKIIQVRKYLVRSDWTIIHATNR